MAFMGMMFIGIFIVMAILVLIFFVISIILKIIGKKKNSFSMKLVGNIFLILGILLVIPVGSITVSIIDSILYEEITLSDGSQKKISDQKAKRMIELALDTNEKDFDELDKLLKEEPVLIDYLDNNKEGIIDYGIKNGNYELVMLALKHGAVFDSKIRYEEASYEGNSMQYLLSECSEREITKEDIKILKLMFEKKASTYVENSDKSRYTNMLGKAAWTVLYNDKRVTNLELEFIQIFIENGLTEDEYLLLYEDIQDHVVDLSCEQLEKDDNYYKLLDMIGYKY